MITCRSSIVDRSTSSLYTGGCRHLLTCPSGQCLWRRTASRESTNSEVSAHQKKDIWGAIDKEVRTLEVYHRRSTHCRKRWEDIRSWSKKMAEAQLGMASQRGRGARRTMTPLMFRILAVAYPELDGRLRASQQPQGASSGGGAVAPEQEGAASHMALEGDTTESEFTSGTEGKGSSTAETEAETSDIDSSSDGSSLAVAGTSVHYSPWSSPPAFVLLVEEQEDKGWKNLKFRFHGVLVPRGMCRGERFPFQVLFPPCFRS
ncbi:hypothetical protein NDU88_004932 [Pleurodeles waltl]|uniref:Uncharacterized protein n=1 Tax=Pleurodeles waltl TaxID=8319 RepID=A0AAV7SKC6_PLEWA|nr:hypothetical protein NDU88_004932 [Pleurodeles waltl]